jgi:hypothetical protein
MQVVELEGVFQLLRGDVERLFLQAPCVDLDALGQLLTEAEAAAEEQASIVQVGGVMIGRGGARLLQAHECCLAHACKYFLVNPYLCHAHCM